MHLEGNNYVGTRGVQKVCGLTMKGKRYMNILAYENLDLYFVTTPPKWGWINGELRDGRVTESPLTRAKDELVDKGERRVS